MSECPPLIEKYAIEFYQGQWEYLQGACDAYQRHGRGAYLISEKSPNGRYYELSMLSMVLLQPYLDYQMELDAVLPMIKRVRQAVSHYDSCSEFLVIVVPWWDDEAESAVAGSPVEEEIWTAEPRRMGFAHWLGEFSIVD